MSDFVSHLKVSLRIISQFVVIAHIFQCPVPRETMEIKPYSMKSLLKATMLDQRRSKVIAVYWMLLATCATRVPSGRSQVTQAISPGYSNDMFITTEEFSLDVHTAYHCFLSCRLFCLFCFESWEPIWFEFRPRL